MVKNRYFKNTLGHFAELVIASALDTEETTGTSGQPSVVSLAIGIAADPTPGDLITITIDGVAYTHTVPVGDETTAAAHNAIVALLAGNTQGFTVSNHSGTTSTVIELAWGNSEANNGKEVTSAETGSTFTAFADTEFAGGVSADAAASDDLESFAADSNAGTVWAFWEDLNSAGRHAALATGDTRQAANINRKFFYAWKDQEGNLRTTQAIPVNGLKYDTKAYNAGQLQISTITYGGTIGVGQILHLRITETTPGILPYPTYNYQTPFVTDLATTVNNLEAEVNAELTANSPIATAVATAGALALTGTSKLRTFKLSGFIEVTPNEPDDESTVTIAYSGGANVPAIAPTGDAAFVRELNMYRLIYEGGINYAPEGTTLEEWQTSTGSNIIASVTQWGILYVKSNKVEDGVVRNHTAKGYCIVVVPTGSEATLALL